MSLPLQPTQQYIRANMTPEYIASLLAGSQAFTATVHGDPIACIGLIEHWPAMHAHLQRMRDRPAYRRAEEKGGPVALKQLFTAKS